MRVKRAALVAGMGCLAVMSLGGQAMAVTASGPQSRVSVEEPPLGVDAVATALERRGFEVAEGDFNLWGIDECPASYALMKSCYFNNPTSPYNFVMLPPWPEEYTDPATEAALGMNVAVPGPTPEGSGAVYRLDPNEAILVFGQLPSRGAYFGLQSYQFTRKGDYKTDNTTYEAVAGLHATDVFFHRVPGNPARIGSFDSLSNSINNVVIERQSGSSWGETRYFVISPDRYMDKQVRQVLHRLAVSASDVFSEAIPRNVTMGLGPDADEFVSFLRYARPDDGGGEGTPSWQWRQDPTLSVLRIRDDRRRPQQAFPAWVDTSPEIRTGVSERYLEEDRNDLVGKVAAAWGRPCPGGNCLASGRAVEFVDTQSFPLNLVGPKCSLIGMDCLGDTQDTSYQFRPGQRYDDGEVYAVVGALGTQTGNATYVSLGVNNTRLKLGALNVDGAQLEGSAQSYGVAHADKFFVHYFTRDCTKVKSLPEGSCTSVTDEESVIPGGDPASFVERDYIAPGTQRGPDSPLLLPSIALELQAPSS